MEIQVVFRDADLLIIDKPAGMVVNRAQSVRGKTVQDWAEPLITENPASARAGTEASDFLSRAGIVHRLDKETSGALIIARNEPAFIRLQELFKNRKIRKTYLALVHGKMTPDTGKINAPVGRLPWNRERFGIVPDGKPSVTAYWVRKSFMINSMQVSLVEAYPETGRTHQIRVHFKYAGFPLVGDQAYAGRKTSRSDRSLVGRIMLHAWKLEFTHPVTGKPVVVTVPVPDDMESVINNPS